MDTNVLGRFRILGEPDPPSPRVSCVVACDLTEESHGNFPAWGSPSSSRSACSGASTGG